MDKQLKTINIELRELNELDRSFLAVASDESVDRHGEVVSQEGWDFTNFLKNPVIPWGHDYYNPPIAKATEIGIMMDNGVKKLMFRPKFASIEEMCSDPSKPSDWALFTDAVYNMFKNGYLRAFSVGFISKQMKGEKHMQNELLEVSAVTIPSNPNALALAYSKGVLSNEQAKLFVSHHENSIEHIENLKKELQTDKSICDNEDMSTELVQLKEQIAELKQLILDNLIAKEVSENNETAEAPVETEVAPEVNDTEIVDTEKDANNVEAEVETPAETEGAASNEEITVTVDEVKLAYEKAYKEQLALAKGIID